MIVLDVDPEKALARQDEPDRIGSEGVEFQTAVRDGYLHLERTDPLVSVLDGSLPVDVLIDQIMEIVT